MIFSQFSTSTYFLPISELIDSVHDDWTVEVVGNFAHSETVQRDAHLLYFKFPKQSLWGYVGGAPGERVCALTTPKGGFCILPDHVGPNGNSLTLTSAGKMYGNGSTSHLNTFHYFLPYANLILSKSGNFNATVAAIRALRLYNRCLSAEEVQTNYEADKARFGIG